MPGAGLGQGQRRSRTPGGPQQTRNWRRCQWHARYLVQWVPRIPPLPIRPPFVERVGTTGRLASRVSPLYQEVAVSDQPTRSTIRTFVLRKGGHPLEERTIELGLKPVIIDDTPDRQALFFTFDGPGVLGLRANATGTQHRHVAPATDAITDSGPVSAWIESVGL